MALANDNSKPTSYELEVLTIVNNEGNGFDVRDLLVNCKLYESITSNYLTGTLSIIDSINLFETAKLFGQESLRIKISQPADRMDDLILVLSSLNFLK